MRIEKSGLVNKDPVLSLAYNSSQKILAIGQMGDTVNSPCLTLWKVFEKNSKKVIERNAYRNIWAVCFDYSGKYLMYSDNSKLPLLDIESGKKSELVVDNNKITKIISFKSSPKIIVSCKHVQVVNIDTKEIIWKLEGYQAETKTVDLEIQDLPTEWKIKKSLNFINEPGECRSF